MENEDGAVTIWAVAALLALAVALLVRLRMGSFRDSKKIQDWMRRF